MVDDLNKLEKTEEIEEVEDSENNDESVDTVAQELRDEDGYVLKRKVKHDCDSRKRLEKKLEETRIQKQVQGYDFDHLD
ncbi:MAG: hypothetical protein NZ697_03835 [Porticoccaceae bacterium]|nr:hypothetical protein [Porticoccaceae bacterium]